MTKDLAELARAATPGPWELSRGEWIIQSSHRGRPIGGSSDPFVDKEKYAQWIVHIHPEHRHRPAYEQQANAAYIAACSPERILALLAVVEAARDMRKMGALDAMWTEGGRLEEFDDALAAYEALK